MKSIKIKMILSIELIILIIIIGLTAISLNMSSSALMNTVNQTMPAIAAQAASVVHSRTHEQLSLLESIASREHISNSNVSTDYKLATLARDVEKYSYIKLGISDLDGNITFNNNTSTDISSREYFKKALAGEANVSDPLMSQTEKRIVVVYAAPIKENDKIIGVLTATREGDEISSLVNDITFGETGRAFMLADSGIKIAHYNNELVINMDNDIENAKENSNLKELAALQARMIKGETGSGTYYYNGSRKFLAFAPVRDTTWSLAVVVEQNEVLSELYFIRIMSIILAVIFIALSSIIIYIIASNLTKGIKAATNYILPMAAGDFTNTVAPQHLSLKDEIGQMLNSIHTMQQSVKEMLKSVMDNSAKIDLDSQSLSAVSEELSSSSGTVALAVQEVTKGATSQAEALTSITEGLNSFSESLGQILKNIGEVDLNSKEIITLAGESNTQMHTLSDSVNATNSTFKNFSTGIVSLGENISEINAMTNLIKSISDQTNLLALNAAIEAARAGESGKGFAVVADEIRKLAEQSKESSDSIFELINKINKESHSMIAATEEVGNEFANQVVVIDKTLASFSSIINAIKEIIPKIGNINTSTENIDRQKNDIVDKIESIAAISEETSATSEEISASTEDMHSSSEEVSASAINLSSRTQEMMNQVNKFKI